MAGVKINLRLNWLSFFGYYITKLLYYFLFDVICCYVCQLRQQQVDDNNECKCDGDVEVDHVTKNNPAQAVMVINGTKPVTSPGNCNKLTKEAYFQSSTSFLNNNSDDSDYDGDDESWDDDSTDNEPEINPKQRPEQYRRNSDDVQQERFELVPEVPEIINTKPSKPKRKSSHSKRSKTSKPKKTKAKRSKPSQLKKGKVMGNATTTQQQIKVDSVTTNDSDDSVHAWGGGTMNPQHHSIKSTAAAIEQDGCTTICVQCTNFS